MRKELTQDGSEDSPKTADSPVSSEDGKTKKKRRSKPGKTEKAETTPSARTETNKSAPSSDDSATIAGDKP